MWNFVNITVCNYKCGYTEKSIDKDIFYKQAEHLLNKYIIVAGHKSIITKSNAVFVRILKWLLLPIAGWNVLPSGKPDPYAEHKC